jgi:hypothetical protein
MLNGLFTMHARAVDPFPVLACLTNAIRTAATMPFRIQPGREIP